MNIATTAMCADALAHFSLCRMLDALQCSCRAQGVREETG
jgi:hypothetical protein